LFAVQPESSAIQLRRASTLDDLCDALLEAGWLSALVVAPLLFNVYALHTFENALLIRSIALLMAAVGLTKVLTHPRRLRPLWRQRATLLHTRAHRAYLAVAAVVLATLASTATSILPAMSFWGSFTRRQGAYTALGYVVIFVAVSTTLRHREQLARFCQTVVVTGLPITIYALLQRAGRDPFLWSGGNGPRPTSTLGNSSFLGGYLVLALPITAFLLVERLRQDAPLTFRDILRRAGDDPGCWLLAIALVLQVLTLSLTGARAAILGATTAIVVTAFVTALLQRKHVVAWGIGGAALIALAGVCLGDFAGPRFAFIRQAPLIGQAARALDASDPTSRTRVLLWQAAGRLILPHSAVTDSEGHRDVLNVLRPLLGYGPETEGVLLERFMSPEILHYEGGSSVPDRVHNFLLDTVATTGLLGLIAQICFWTAVLSAAIAAARKSGHGANARLLAICLLCAIVGHLAETIFSFEITPTSTYAFAYGGLVVALLLGLEARERPSSTPLPAGTSGSRRDLLAHGALPAVLCCLTLIVLLYDFIIVPGSLSIFEVIQRSFGTLHQGGRGESYGVALVLASALAGWSILGSRGQRATSIAAFIPVPIAAAFAAWQVHILRGPGPTASVADGVVTRAEVITHLAGWLFGSILAIATCISLARVNRPIAARRSWSMLALLAICACAGSFISNLRPLEAEIALQIGRDIGRASPGNRPLALISLATAVALDPAEEATHLALGEAYLPAQPSQLSNAAINWPDAITHGLAELDAAKAANPFDPLPFSERARAAEMNLLLGPGAEGQEDWRTVADQAFMAAVALDPTRPERWNEWARFEARSGGDYLRAMELLQHSIFLDPELDSSLRLWDEIDPAQRSHWLITTAAFEARTPSQERDLGQWFASQLVLGSTFYGLHEDEQAKLAYQQALHHIPQNVNPWAAHLALAQVYFRTGDRLNAESEVSAARATAPPFAAGSFKILPTAR